MSNISNKWLLAFIVSLSVFVVIISLGNTGGIDSADIANESIIEEDFSCVDIPADGEFFTYDAATQGCQWAPGVGGAVDISDDTNLTASDGVQLIGDDVSISSITSVHILDNDIKFADLDISGSVTDEFFVTIETSTGGFEVVAGGGGGGVHPVDQASDITGISPVANGGTGISSVSDDQILIGTAGGVLVASGIPDCNLFTWERNQYNAAANLWNCVSDRIDSNDILDDDILLADLHITGTLTDEFCVTIETSFGDGMEAQTCGGGVHPVNQASDVTGTLGVANGGTGQTAATEDGFLIGNGSIFAISIGVDCNTSPFFRTQYDTATNLLTCDTSQIDISAGTNLVAGANITLTGDSLSIDDDYLFNTGDIGTGVFDFGGAGSIEIPNGAGGTVVNALGEITIDGTTDTLNFYDGTAERVLDPERVFGITVENPDASEDISLMRLDFPMTVIWEECVLTGSLTPSLTLTLRHGTDRNATGAELVTGGNVITSTTGGDNDVTFNDATIVTDSFLWLETTAQSGTVDSASCSWGANIDE